MNEEMYIAADGTVLTDELVEELAAEAENGFANSVLTPVEGRPWETRTEPMRTRSVRLPATVWNLVEADAKSRHMSVSAWTRQAIMRNITPNEPAKAAA